MFHPFSATTVLRTMNTAAEIVVPVMAAIILNVLYYLGMFGTNPWNISLIPGLTMKNTIMNFISNQKISTKGSL